MLHDPTLTVKSHLRLSSRTLTHCIQCPQNEIEDAYLQVGQRNSPMYGHGTVDSGITTLKTPLTRITACSVKHSLVVCV